MKYIRTSYVPNYLLTIILPAIKRVAGDTLCFSRTQCTSASAHKTIELLKRKTPDFISLDLWPPNSPNLNLVDYKLWGSCNSGFVRRRSRMWMKSRSDWLKSGLVWTLEQNIIDTAINAWRNRLRATPCLCSRKGPTYRTLTVAVEQRDIILFKLSARVTEM